MSYGPAPQEHQVVYTTLAFDEPWTLDNYLKVDGWKAWKKILAEASQQSRRVRIPELQPISQATQAFAAQNPAAAKVMLSERPDTASIRQILEAEPTRKQAVLAIGPEGGWTDAEFTAAQTSGLREASLGNLILRTETAVVAALASINYALDE